MPYLLFQVVQLLFRLLRNPLKLFLFVLLALVELLGARSLILDLLVLELLHDLVQSLIDNIVDSADTHLQRTHHHLLQSYGVASA